MLDFIVEHWPFISVALILSSFGHAAKQTLLTDDNVRKYKIAWWGRKTMAIHPVIVGAGIGLLSAIPASSGVDGTVSRVLYFAFAGVMSTWGYSVAKGLLKRQGIDISMPGESIRPGSHDHQNDIR